ncbi:MAG: N-acetyltransferase family protein [Chitinophagaceae bacterium]
MRKALKTGNATFQLSAPEWEEWNNSHLAHSRIVALVDNKIAGWAALTPVSGRCVYAGVGGSECVRCRKIQGAKIGSALLQELIKQSEVNNIWTLQAGIFPENKGSIKIHEENGFRTVGYREKIGQMNGVWRNTVLMEKKKYCCCIK